MGWDSKSVYPPDATNRVSLKATAAQKIAWSTAARRFGYPTTGAFLARAGDFLAAFHRAEVDLYEQAEERRKEEQERKGRTWQG